MEGHMAAKNALESNKELSQHFQTKNEFWHFLGATNISFMK